MADKLTGLHGGQASAEQLQRSSRASQPGWQWTCHVCECEREEAVYEPGFYQHVTVIEI